MSRPRWGTVISLTLLMLGCTSTPPPSPSPTPDELADLRGGTLRVAMDLVGHEVFQLDVPMDEGQPPRFDHIWDPTTTWAPEPFELFRCCLLRTLMSYNGRPANEGGALLQPDLADDYPDISADGLTWTFTLKEGLHYAPPMADKLIQAADFVRALERALRPDPFRRPDEPPRIFGPYAGFFRDVIEGADQYGNGDVSSISGLEARDERTLVIHLTRPAGDLGARLAMPAAAPIPSGAADGHDAGYGRYLVASGPYMIEGSEQLNPGLPADQQPTVPGYVPGASLTLVRNTSWANNSLRAALVERIEIAQADDYDAVKQALLDDQTDIGFLMDLDPSDIDAFRADSAIAPRLHVAPSLQSRWIQMNLAVPPFDDIHVRRAINLVTNKRALVDTLFPGERIQRHAIPDAFENGLLSNYDPYATVDDRGSLESAKSEMSLSRYDTDRDGTCDQPSCSSIHVPIRDNQPELGTAADAFAATVAQLGVDLSIEAVDTEEWFNYWHDPSNHAALTFWYGWASDYLNAAAWYGPLATGAGISAEDVSNLSMIGASPDQLTSFGYTVTEVPSLNDQIAACTGRTGTAQFECWAEVDQYLMERVVPWVPVSNVQASRLTSPSVTRFSFDESITMPALDQIALDQAP